MRSGIVCAAAVLALAVLPVAAPSLARDPDNAIVTTRQAAMKEMAAAAKAIAEMFDGKRAYERRPSRQRRAHSAPAPAVL
ncbi:hypothetical protein LB534_07540 [Mesorhizobium sp. CA18]|uniref:hypothetical protein n=1 Tax=unclassified Mesorhizobium TaxID=325217 RepID=UPI001CC949C1|nr:MULTISPECIES: hypothetical protein [unclassified Mesorhizobium]MBZ9734124.1 hypothetical protein [Mesorhizobium sp. CA9]MBZ9825135.1 hypothetical protein [Mesorhizobium sp. CA18]MBZ9832178.1 hypothetical protein [Mesorhizobium sp. CA2]MBZ9836672.1 hypothetical protein [Mesorhizobium sp. CA3]MBZ9878292.1 hypothetical protein [Mesorhizobium sp. Ca11]